jgi:O-antigen/teichoic acid export membrane protein
MPSDSQTPTPEVDALPKRSGWANDTSLFASRVAVIFATKIAQFVMGAATLFLIAKLLGTEGNGEYTVLTVWVGMLFAFGQLGMPAAMTFMAGRGGSVRTLERISIGLTFAISVCVAAVAIIALPVLTSTVLVALGGGRASDDLLKLMLLGVPLLLLTQFGGGILYTHGRNRAYNRVQVLVAAMFLVLTLVLVGVAQLGVAGATVAYLAANGIGAAAVAIEVHKLAAAAHAEVTGSVSIRGFASYGLKLYPQSITSFFSYRADVLLLSWMTADLNLVGLYGIAVRIAEMTFYVPDSIAAMMYPAISASNRAEADRLAPMICRLAMLVTLAAVLAVIPAGVLGIWFLLPTYRPAIPAMVVIMPGILSLSLSKVLSAYVSGLGRPIATAVAGFANLGTNIAANLILIPAWGIVGASAASVISYSCHAVILLVVSSRWAGVSTLAFIVPRRAEFERVWRMAGGALATLRARVPRRGDGPLAG